MSNSSFFALEFCSRQKIIVISTIETVMTISTCTTEASTIMTFIVA